MAVIEEIQSLQFRDLPAAEALTLRWLQQDLKLNAAQVTLSPKAVSLNSFNGFAILDGQEVFFKSHIEPESVIAEYYNAQAMHDAGYNVVLPLRTVHESGQQIAFYPKVTAPVVFDLMREVELGTAEKGTATEVLEAERSECAQLLRTYQHNSSEADREQNASAAIHQLFWHRLTGGRYDTFYGGSALTLPGGDHAVPFLDLLDKTFVVNGVEQPRTLGRLLQEAREVLDPVQPSLVVPGHGDAHYGNVFLDGDNRFLYFDPAFGGRHSPLLDVVKPLYHNVFAQWMYFPQEKASSLQTSVRMDGGFVHVDYLPYVPPARQEILKVKRKELVEPLVSWLNDAGALPQGTRPLELALACCPLLTMNLTDSEKFPPETAWAGLSQVLQMGNWDVEQDLRLSPPARSAEVLLG